MNLGNNSQPTNLKGYFSRAKSHRISWPRRFVGNHWFFILLLVSIIFLIIPGNIKLRLFEVPRSILLAPLNITIRLFTNFSNLNQENKRLSLLATELQIENNALREQLYKRGSEFVKPGYTMQRAQINGRDRETMSNFLLIDQGESAEIKTNLPVINEAGIVGKVIQTARWQSLVETMLSPDSKIAALDQRSRILGVVTAHKDNRLKMNYVTPDADIQIGDTIISSGIGGVFPKGLLIGTVTKIENRPTIDGLFKEIIIKPFVDIYAIETVYLITGGSKPEPPKSRPKTEMTDWEKLLKQMKIEPPIEIKIR
jgi:rod shape-determining protein MreC